MSGLMAGWSIRTPFIIYGILALTAIVPSLYLVRESAPSVQKQYTRKESLELGTKDFLKTLLKFHTVAFFSAQFFASVARGALWSGTLLLYAVFVYDASPQAPGVLSTTAGVIGIPITLSAGYLMDRFGRKTTIVPGFALTGAGLILLALSAHWAWSLTLFIAGFLWVNGAQHITSGSMQVLGSDMAPEAGRGRFFGVWRLCGETGHVMAPIVFAVLAERIAYSASFTFIGLCAFAAAALIGFQVRETVGRGKL
jgi:MFS family permease